MKYQDRFKSRGQLAKELAAAHRRIAELETSVEDFRSVSAALKESEAEVRAIVDALPDLVIRLHRDGTFLDIKSPSEDILSRPTDEIIGRNILETGLPEKVIAIHLWNMEAALRTRSVQAFEYPLELAGGRRDFEGRVIACSDQEVLFVIRDITDSKRANERLRQVESQLHQARRMESVGRLAAGVAHNLNNLLAPILGYAELLADHPADDDQQLQIGAILKAADDARELTRQLLAVGHEQEHKVRRIDLREVVGKYERFLRGAIRRSVTLHFQQASHPVMIEADPFQIQQILLNLAINAQDAIADHGRVDIDVRSVVVDGADPRLRPGPYGCLRVLDTGSGIESNLREQIFDPFFTTKESGKGTGLGLASVLGIVRRHGGEIRLESVVGEGSTFEILFPLCSDAAEIPETPDRPDDTRDRQITVLVVEADEIVNRLVSRVLRDARYLVLTAAGGEECLHLAKRHQGPIDLLLTEFFLPDIDGSELYRLLKPLLPNLAVLYMSERADEVPKSSSPGDRINLVQKPFSTPHLLHEVNRVLATATAKVKSSHSR